MLKKIYLVFFILLIFNSLKSQQRDTLIKISSNENSGFNYPYFLYIPKVIDEKAVLLVAPNNTGTVNDTLKVHEDEALDLATKYKIGYRLAKELKIPLLVPVFPRPLSQWKIYTHALDRDAMVLDSGKMKRIDLQLISMINDARKKLDSLGIHTQEKVFLNGFSASGTFVNRFTLLHPEYVKAVASGGVNGICILPLKKYKWKKLKYPIGIADYEKILNHKFEIEIYKSVPQYIYMGEKDNNDATLFKDSYSPEESNLIYKVIGKKMMPDRFIACESFYKKANINAEFKVYTGLSHEVDKQIFNDLCIFFNKFKNNITLKDKNN